MQRSAGDSRLYGSRMVFMVLGEWSGEAMRLAGLLNENNVPVTAYIIANKPETSSGTRQGIKIHYISPETDLREVL